jgi:hypothetical protein
MEVRHHKIMKWRLQVEWDLRNSYKKICKFRKNTDSKSDRGKRPIDKAIAAYVDQALVLQDVRAVESRASMLVELEMA